MKFIRQFGWFMMFSYFGAMHGFGGIDLTDFIEDTNANTNLWDVSATIADANGRKFSADGQSIVSFVYPGAVVKISLSAKNVNFKKDGAASYLLLEGRKSEQLDWDELHRLRFANGSATNETVNLSRSDNYRQFKITFLKGAGTMRVGSFEATVRSDGEVVVPGGLDAVRITSSSFCAKWQSEERVDGFIFNCWREDMTPWSGDVKWVENFDKCVNGGNSPKAITSGMFDDYTDLTGWSGDLIYASAQANGAIQIGKSTDGVGWLISPELRGAVESELVLRARSFAESDLEMPVYIIRGDVTNMVASFALKTTFADYNCTLPEILDGDRLAFRSFAEKSKRRVSVDSVSIVGNFRPSQPAISPVIADAAVEYSESPSYEVGGLTPGKIYGFNVRAVSGAVESANSGTFNLSTLMEEIEEEENEWSGGIASGITSTSFKLDWEPVPGASEYRVSVWTNLLEGASQGNATWEETFSRAMQSTSSSPRAINDSDRFNEDYSDNDGWIVASNIYPSAIVGSVRLGNTSNPGELKSPFMALTQGSAISLSMKRHSADEGLMFCPYVEVDGNLKQIGEPVEVGLEFKSYKWPILESFESCRLVLRSVYGKSSYRTIVDSIEVVEGYSAGMSVPDYFLEAIAVNGESYNVDSLTAETWHYSVEALDPAGKVICSATNTVDLADIPPCPVLNAVELASLVKIGGMRCYEENFDSFADVFDTNESDWINGVTVPYWQSYYGSAAIEVIKRNAGSGTAKGLYAFRGSNEDIETYSLGTLTSSKAERFVYGLCFKNNTSATQRKTVVKYDGVQFGFRNTVAQELVCEYIVTNELVSIASGGNWQRIDELLYSTPEDSSSGLKGGTDLPITTVLSAELSGIAIPQDAYFMVRWRREAGTNSAAIGIDNISVSFYGQARPLTIVVR
ncbi:MAG: hypothetical protein J6R18_08010 [Kiritimatiellae bacterium]|nr:hypothetical protein [Kiritimatiellia bacterium]